jgi:hypothetical protein
MWSRFNGTSWSAPRSIDPDSRGAFAVVAAATNGRVVASWLRATAAPLSDDPQALRAYFKTFEVVTAMYDDSSQSWTNEQQLTNDTAADTDLRIAAYDSRVLLTWQSNSDGELVGTTTSPSTLRYASLNGNSWSAIGTIVSGLTNVVHHVTSLGKTNGVAVLAKERIDTSVSQASVAAYTWDFARWSAVTIGDPTVDNRSPVVAHDQNSQAHVVWISDSNLVEAVLPNTTPAIIRPASRTLAFQAATLLPSPSGHLSLIREDIASGGAAHVFAMTYDPVAHTWSTDLPLTDENSVAHEFTGYFDASEVLHGAFLATSVDYTTDVVDVSGVPTRIANVPHEADTELLLLDHRLATDLAVSNADVTLSNREPSAGDNLTITVTVHNNGDFTTPACQVGVFNGDPDKGGKLLTSTTVPVLRGGESGHAQLSFVVSTNLTQLVIVVDAANAINEVSKANNRVTLPLGNRAPDARVVASSTSGKAPMNITFDATRSSDPDGDPVTFYWVFDDGAPAQEGAVVTHRFDRPGDYAVSVIAVDSRGARSSATVMVKVASAKQRGVRH